LKIEHCFVTSHPKSACYRLQVDENGVIRVFDGDKESLGFTAESMANEFTTPSEMAPTNERGTTTR
jgi:hypothetical protein